MCPQSKQKRIPSMKITAPLMIRAEVFVKHPAIKTAIPPQLVKKGSKTIPTTRTNMSNLEEDWKQLLQRPWNRWCWEWWPWLGLQMGTPTECSSLPIVSLSRVSPFEVLKELWSVKNRRLFALFWRFCRLISLQLEHLCGPVVLSKASRVIGEVVLFVYFD